MDFSNKVIIITGASSGIGAATALYFSKLSAKLVLVARNEKNLQKIALYCEKAKGIMPLSIAIDVTEEKAAEKIIQDTVAHFGKVDVLVNSAGIVEMGGIKNSTLESYDKVMSTNMRAVYGITMAAVPHLIPTKGNIINVSCTAGLKPSTMSLAYSVSKAALDHFTRCVALELAPDGVRVNSVSPSYLKTNLLKSTGLTVDQLELYSQNVIGNMPLKKPIEGPDVAALIGYLASDTAKSITGVNYPIDGGSLVR